MSIKDFEDLLKSQLAVDAKKLGPGGLFLDSIYWRAMLTSPGFDALRPFIVCNTRSLSLAKTIHMEVTDIPGLEKHLQTIKVIPTLEIRVFQTTGRQWCELIIESIG